MAIVALIVFGLCLGSFVNALVWRLREQELQAAKKKPNAEYVAKLSITKGRSMCPHCKHELAATDLIPVFSWVWLRGKCHYCRKAISAEYPLVELGTASAFVASYIWWPTEITGTEWVQFVVWLGALVALMALLVYDVHYKLLPDRIMALLGALGGVYVVVAITQAAEPLQQLLATILAVAVGGGIFYVLFQVSDGKWIGGGDVKLGWVIGLFVGSPALSFLVIFVASLLGTAASLPLLVSKRLSRASTIPFGPYLIIATVIALLFGQAILDWYQSTVIQI